MRWPGIVMTAALAGCTLQAVARTVEGSGVVKEETRAVRDFSSIDLAGIGRVVVKQGAKESLKVSAEDNLLPLLESRVVDGTLHLKVADGTSLKPTKPIVFTVEVKSLKGLAMSGAGSIEATDVKADQLKVLVSGAGDVSATGQVDALDLRITGAGNFAGNKLEARRARVDLSGTGNAKVRASEELDANVSGVGSVEYLGDPKVKKTITGVGSVRKGR